MAFDHPIEADRVDDLGLLSSLIRAPVLGIMWLLGGEHGKEAEEEEMQKNQEKEQIEQKILGESDGGGEGEGDSAEGHADSTDGHYDRSQADMNDYGPPNTNTSRQPVDEAEVNGHDKENNSSLLNWPSVGFLDSPNEDMSNCKSKQVANDNDSNVRSCSSRHSPRRNESTDNVIDDLVAVMESSHIKDHQTDSDSPGPATSAVLTSQSKMTSSSTNSLTATYSASTFSNHHTTSQTLSLHSSINNGIQHLSQASRNNSNSSIRGSKKMSWSDECGNRSLVEVEYFDDTATAQPQSKHWSAMKRNGSTLESRSRRNSFDGDSGAGTRRSEVRVIKSALKRSGSYSPPVALYASNNKGVTASTSSSSDSSSMPSSSGMKSFRSISVIGSSDSSRSNSSDEMKESASAHSHDTIDSMAAVTNKKLNSNDVHVPSTLQVGCGRASGGLVIPRGPSDSRYYFPRGGPNDPRYQLILGTHVPAIVGGQPADANIQGGQGEKNAQDVVNAKAGSYPNPATATTSGLGSPGHHHFLPRPNGYISPQYGFYVNITPPTPEMYAKAGDKSSRHTTLQQQSYQQFQYQNKYQAPSPIPEGAPGGAQGIPQRFVGRASVPRPSSNRSSGERDSLNAARQNSLKPTFTKNKKGMGMILAENPHHGVWPTVPFG